MGRRVTDRRARRCLVDAGLHSYDMATPMRGG